MKTLEVLDPVIFADSRGTVTTFLPPDPIVEYNLITLRAGDVRGMHYHPHFTEYLLFVSGEGYLTWREPDDDRTWGMDVEQGISTRAEPGVAHAVRAETDLTFIAMLTRRWDDCDPPIVRCAV